MSKKFGLGKGLDFLLPQDDKAKEPKQEKISPVRTTRKSSKPSVAKPAAPKAEKEVEPLTEKLDINRIKPNKEQARKIFDETRLLELAESIKEHGIIQPLVVTKSKTGEDYMIVAGERRWRAAKRAGLKEVPVVYATFSDQQVMEISLIENIQRADLNPVEEAAAYKRLMDDFDMTQEQISKRVGKSRVAISNTIRLMNLDERVIDYLSDGVITEGHGRALLASPDKDFQYKIAQRIIDEGMSVRETEKLIKNYDKMKDLRSRERKKDVFLEDLAARIGGYFGTKVSFKPKSKNRGKIEIEYYNQEDLDRILEILHVDE